MCGIYAVFVHNGQKVIDWSSFESIRHRGPEMTTTLSFEDEISPWRLDQKETKIMSVFFGFHRLAITGEHDGTQPFNLSDKYYLICNGEIYNYQDLIKDHNLPVKSKSDCEVILHLYGKYGITQTCKLLNGDFAFVLYDRTQKKVYFARDRFGVRPLFMSLHNGLFLASEAKAILQNPESPGGLAEGRGVIEQVIPRNVYEYDLTSEFLHTYEYYTLPVHKEQDSCWLSNLRVFFDGAVRRRITVGDREIGFLLSGGLDSSLVLSVAMKYLFEESPTVRTQPVQAFSFGFHEDAPDLINARKVAEFLRNKYGKDKLIHHIVICSIEEGLDAIPKVIKHLESYDTTTVRASTPMYLLSKYISQKTNVKVILSGEGADELLGGYLYFHYAPNQEAFVAETHKLLYNLHLYDTLRADRMTATWGLELRVPFLDMNFVGYVCMFTDIAYSHNTKSIEKQIMRMAYADNYLPKDVLNAQKNAFSDAVGYDWKKRVRDYANIALAMLAPPTPASRHNPLQASFGVVFVGDLNQLHNPPIHPEEFWFRYLFETFYPGCGEWIPKMWLPNWVDTKGESSATALNVHNHSIKIET